LKRRANKAEEKHHFYLKRNRPEKIDVLRWLDPPPWSSFEGMRRNIFKVPA
jgi:hypothetical protein